MLRQLTLADMPDVARVHRAAFDHALPWLTGLHTPQEDLRFYREQMFLTCTLWGAFDGSAMIGIIAFRDDWIDQLYVLPDAQGRRVGTALLEVAQGAYPRLHAWTFQRNAPARRFYERRSFVLVRETSGADNEEKEPDALYCWMRG
jgi:GNAT superfamily N-acetyltransferase